MTLGKAGAVVVGGVDCIVDVGATTSSIVLGENHQVTIDFQMEHGFVWRLTFTADGDTIRTKGTMTSDETCEGFTQEITLDMKITGD